MIRISILVLICPFLLIDKKKIKDNTRLKTKKNKNVDSVESDKTFFSDYFKINNYKMKNMWPIIKMLKVAFGEKYFFADIDNAEWIKTHASGNFKVIKKIRTFHIKMIYKKKNPFCDRQLPHC